MKVAVNYQWSCHPNRLVLYRASEYQCRFSGRFSRLFAKPRLPSYTSPNPTKKKKCDPFFMGRSKSHGSFVVNTWLIKLRMAAKTWQSARMICCSNFRAAARCLACKNDIILLLLTGLSSIGKHSAEIQAYGYEIYLLEIGFAGYRTVFSGPFTTKEQNFFRRKSMNYFYGHLYHLFISAAQGKP